MALAVGTGIGSEQRRPLGIAVVGGLLFSQAITLFTTPVVYLFMEHSRQWVKCLKGRMAQALARPTSKRERVPVS